MNQIHRWLFRSNAWRKKLEGVMLPWVLDGIDLGTSVLEIGSGPGLTTGALRRRCARMTAIEIDPRLAGALGRGMAGRNVSVVLGDATAMPFARERFSSAVCFTMLHHVASVELQDRLLGQRTGRGGALQSNRKHAAAALRCARVFRERYGACCGREPALRAPIASGAGYSEFCISATR
ncbi:MAG: methyltransferase domain-containing protein [Bryobacteraceae bacterium]